jgi:hypothetical protein
MIQQTQQISLEKNREFVRLIKQEYEDFLKTQIKTTAFLENIEEKILEIQTDPSLDQTEIDKAVANLTLQKEIYEQEIELDEQRFLHSLANKVINNKISLPKIKKIVPILGRLLEPFVDTINKQNREKIREAYAQVDVNIPTESATNSINLSNLDNEKPEDILTEPNQIENQPKSTFEFTYISEYDSQEYLTDGARNWIRKIQKILAQPDHVKSISLLKTKWESFYPNENQTFETLSEWSRDFLLENYTKKYGEENALQVLEDKQTILVKPFNPRDISSFAKIGNWEFGFEIAKRSRKVKTETRKTSSFATNYKRDNYDSWDVYEDYLTYTKYIIKYKDQTFIIPIEKQEQSLKIRYMNLTVVPEFIKEYYPDAVVADTVAPLWILECDYIEPSEDEKREVEIEISSINGKEIKIPDYLVKEWIKYGNHGGPSIYQLTFKEYVSSCLIKGWWDSKIEDDE